MMSQSLMLYKSLRRSKIGNLKCVGCKDIGLNFEQYKDLFGRFKKYGLRSFLEVVTYREEEHFKGIDLALKIGADNVIGGMPPYTTKTVAYLKQKQSGTRFFPYIGTVTGHPCILGGQIDDIVKEGKEAEENKVDGINLLLYRYTGDQGRLLRATVRELKVPLIVAGNVANFDQIRELKENNVWAFTIGGAVLEKRFVEAGTTREQIEAILGKL